MTDWLVGIAIEAAGREKFVGKVGLLSTGQRVLYREANFRDFYSFKTDAISIDREAADYAIDVLGADYMACYCKDTRDLYVTPVTEIKAASIVDLGELPQYRIPLQLLERYPNHSPLRLGFTTDVRRLKAMPTKTGA